MNQIIEGTWEEVLQRGDELAGHRVKVIVLDQEAQTQSVAEAMQGRIGQLSFDVPSDIHEKAAEIFARIIVEKHRTIPETSPTSAAERAAAFQAWASQSRPDLPMLSDEAISRETMYDECE
ncbi:MAG: hypothetical protein AAFY15_01860 [Cyanobacteria bacterium J06648_11]